MLNCSRIRSRVTRPRARAASLFLSTRANEREMTFRVPECRRYSIVACLMKIIARGRAIIYMDDSRMIGAQMQVQMHLRMHRGLL